MNMWRPALIKLTISGVDYYLSDHNRQPVQESNEKIENSKRMANGLMSGAPGQLNGGMQQGGAGQMVTLGNGMTLNPMQVNALAQKGFHVTMSPTGQQVLVDGSGMEVQQAAMPGLLSQLPNVGGIAGGLNRALAYAAKFGNPYIVLLDHAWSLLLLNLLLPTILCIESPLCPECDPV